MTYLFFIQSYISLFSFMTARFLSCVTVTIFTVYSVGIWQTLILILSVDFKKLLGALWYKHNECVSMAVLPAWMTGCSSGSQYKCHTQVIVRSGCDSVVRKLLGSTVASKCHNHLFVKLSASLSTEEILGTWSCIIAPLHLHTYKCSIVPAQDCWRTTMLLLIKT